jgi:glycosyltransferase involved in cell wall biosynthesis
MTRVWLVNWFADRSGGADVYTENLAVGLAARGHRVTVACYGASPRVEACCRVVRVPRPEHRNRPVVWRLAPALVGPHWHWHLGRVRGPMPDVIVFSPALCRAALARRFPGVPMVYLPHARVAPVEVAGTVQPGFARWLAYRTQFRAERESLLRSAVTVRFTTGAADALRRFYRLPSRVRFEVIPAAVDVPAELSRPQERSGLRLLSVGRLIESKNLRFLFDVLARFRDRPWRLDVVGDGPERAGLEAAAAALGVADRVTFHGHQPDVGRFYAAADLLAFPSRLESFGLVTLEAMAHGVPALAIRADGVRYLNVHHEVIRDGIDGLLASDEDDFARRLRDCLDHPALVRELGAAARRAAAGHTWPAALDHWERLLAGLTGARV